MAARIAHRLADRAVEHGGARAWEIESGGPAGDLYHGSAGIALFLAEAARLSGEARLARAAEGGIRHALAWAGTLPPGGWALFTGRAGVAYAAARVGALLGCEELVATAPASLRALAAAPSGVDEEDDVIGGWAGMVLAALLLEPWADGEDARGTAAALAERLLARAVFEPWGWSWPMVNPRWVRGLLGYAHGASGIGHALLEAAAATGRAEFRHGAEQAWLYERRFFHPPTRNWPDFRHAPGDPGPGAPLPYLPRFAAAWCAGAGGIGLARARAFALLGDPVYRRALEAAVATLRERPRDGGYNYSLCHGAGGTAELFLHAAGALGDPSLRAAAEAIAEEGCRDFETAGRPWPCGTGSGAWDPGLMLGEAGIGHLLLRLADPSVPSILLPVPAAPESAPPPADGPEVRRLRGAAVRDHFGGTIAAFARLGPPAYALPAAPGPLPDPHLAHAALRRRVERETDADMRARLEDAFAVERAAYEVTRGALDLSEERWERGEGRIGDGAGAPDWDRGWIRLTALARVVETAHDWAAWLEGEDALPAPEPARHLVVRAGNRARVRRLTPFAAVVAGALGEPRTLDGLLAEVAAAFPPGAAPPPEALRPAVLGQLASFRALGAVAVHAAPPRERALDRLAAAARGGGDPAPASVRARAALARHVETVLPLLSGDPLLAAAAAVAVPAQTRALLRDALAAPLFAEELEACAAAEGAEAAREALEALLDAVDRSFGGGDLLAPA
jgi:lantibiotic biosynthesis protein